jgi:hypothetical protein
MRKRSVAHPVQTLPPGYQQMYNIHLATDKTLFLALNLASVGMLLLAGWLMLQLIVLLRPDAISGGSFTLTGLPLLLLMTGVTLALIFAMVVLHEAIHGLFFWLFTRARPRFGFKGAYAFAAAPDWYIPRNQYLLIGIAPLVLMTLGGVLLLLIVPAPYILPVALVVVLNAAGAVGDIAVVGWLLFKPSSLLVCDLGDGLIVYFAPEDGR